MLVLAAVISALLADGSAAAPSTRPVAIPTPDGITLRGTYYSPERAGPAIVLIHQCDLTRASWQPLATALSAAGSHVLAVDLRGFGESDGKPTDEAGRRGLAAKWTADMDAMLAWLVAQAGVDKTRLGVGGASCGVPQATSLAARHPALKALFVLSGPANEQGTRHIARTPSLAVLGIAGVQDIGAFEGVRQLVHASPHGASTLKTYPGPEHGVALLEKHVELIPQITAWFGVQLASPTTPPGSDVAPPFK